MTIAELIVELYKFPPDLLVKVHNSDLGVDCDPAWDLEQQWTSYPDWTDHPGPCLVLRDGAS